jgi:hypothetical protein
MADQLPESAFERMTADERAKERVERQKVLVGIPRSTLLQKYHAFTAELSVELQESLEDLLLTANALPGEAAEAQAAKARVIQAGRASLEKANRAVKILYVAAKEGGDAAQRIFNPEPTFAGMNDEEAKILDKIRKEREQAKKKEAEAGKSGWKGLGKRPAPYSFKPGFGGYGGGYGGGYSGGFGGGAADLNSWALQQLLAQQLGGNKGESGKTSSGGGQPPAAAGSAAQAGQPDYATRIAMARIQYPCHACGIMGHCKKDGVCKAADVAAHLQKRMAEQAERDREEDDESGM